MQKKPLIAALIASLLIVPVIVIAFGEEAKANIIFPTNLQISVISPTNKTYISNSVTLNINTSALDSFFEKEKTTQITYNLDKQGNQSIDSTYFLTTLEELSEGSHVLEVYAQYQYYSPQHYPQGPLTLRAYSIVYFTVDTKTPTPTPTLSPTPIQSLFPSVLLDHFTFSDRLAGFNAGNTLCSFDAKAGSFVSFNLSSTGDNSYEVIYQIIGNKQGLVFNYSTYGDSKVFNFNQTVSINQEDSYNITIGKHPFYTTISYFGTIDIYGKEEANTATPPTETPAETLTPNPSATVNPSPTASVSESPQTTTLEANPTPNRRDDYFAHYAITACTVTIMAAVGLLVLILLTKRRRVKQ